MSQWCHSPAGDAVVVLDLAISHDGNFVYSAGEDGAVSEFAATSGNPKKKSVLKTLMWENQGLTGSRENFQGLC